MPGTSHFVRASILETFLTCPNSNPSFGHHRSTITWTGSSDEEGWREAPGWCYQATNFLNNTTPAEAFPQASPYRARASRPRLSPPQLSRGVFAERDFCARLFRRQRRCSLTVHCRDTRTRSAAATCMKVSQGYYDFSAGVALFQIPDRFGGFTQCVTSVDDRCHFARRHELAEYGHILFAAFPNKDDEVLAHEP